MSKVKVNKQPEVKPEPTPEPADTVKVIEGSESKADVAPEIISKPFIDLMRQVDLNQAQTGSKWYDTICYVRDHKDECPPRVLVASLISMGKTKGTAENLASYIGKMAKPEMAEKLEKLNQGKVSVRATRAERLPGERRGRPAKTNIQKLSEHLSAAGALALVCKLDLQRYLDMAQAAYEGSVAGLSEPKTDEPKAESTNKPEPKPEPEAKPELVAA